jgi:ferritin-like metal-binding protein YciE
MDPPEHIRCDLSIFLIDEAQDASGEVDDKDVLDAAIIAAGQAVELPLRLAHSLVQTAWPSEVAKVLERTLREEKAADKKLTTIAESKANVKGGLELVSGASHYNWLLRYSEGKLPRAAIAK